MPSENAASQSQSRPQLGGANNSRSNSMVGSPSTSPSRHAGKPKTQKHVVHGGRTHTKVPSNKGLNKLTKGHGEGSTSELKKSARNFSTTSLKKNSSHISLKRNRSAADVRPKSSRGQATVQFEIGDQEAEDGWEEASTSASPALSRSASRVGSAHSSKKPSADNSRPQTPPSGPPEKTQGTLANGSNEKSSSRHSAITEKLLARTQSHNTTKMSLATATPLARPPESPDRSASSTAPGTPKNGSSGEVVSRFVGGSGTPNSGEPYIQQKRHSDPKGDEVNRRVHSMGNLTRAQMNIYSSDDEESALAPRSRRTSAQHNSYVPPQHSRTQQKLWLQRASSNMEPTQMAPGVVNGFAGLHGSMGGPSLLGAGYDGRDPRIKLQLEKTGLEYLVIRRHQDPVGQALKRLSQLPGADKSKRIPLRKNSKKGDENTATAGRAGAARTGLNQSLKESRTPGPRKENHAHTPSTGSTTGAAGACSYDGNQDESGLSGNTQRDNDDEGVGALLRAMWEKGYDLSASAD